MNKKEELLERVKDKQVFIMSHYDADGVSSGALVYHIIKDHCDVITKTKGIPFAVEPEDIPEHVDIVICVDISCSERLFEQGYEVFLIDHHPNFMLDNFDFKVHDDTKQSCSLLIFEELIPDTNNPFFVFLTLMGYFGDGGNREEIPLDLQMKANDLLKHPTRYGEHNLMCKKNSCYSKGYYLDIERYVSTLNTGKRMHWSGDIPLELLKNIDHYIPFIYNLHPLAAQLSSYKQQLRKEYSKDIKIVETGKVDYAVVKNDKNVQGVYAARYSKDKPLIVMNEFNELIVGSMRVPDHIEFDAGAYLAEFNDKIESLTGGGHEKAGGVTFNKDELEKFLELIRDS